MNTVSKDLSELAWSTPLDLCEPLSAAHKLGNYSSRSKTTSVLFYTVAALERKFRKQNNKSEPHIPLSRLQCIDWIAVEPRENPAILAFCKCAWRSSFNRKCQRGSLNHLCLSWVPIPSVTNVMCYFAGLWPRKVAGISELSKEKRPITIIEQT